MNGQGYPDGLRGEAIPLPARIILVADAFDAVTSDRPYRRSRIPAEALFEIRYHAGTLMPRRSQVFRPGSPARGFGSDLTRAELEQLGSYVCDEDLEDELIRVLGAEAVEELLQANGDLHRLHRFRTLQQMPAWRGRSTEEQLRRSWVAADGARSGTPASSSMRSISAAPLGHQVLAHAAEH